eukprot:213747-Chlamydomonas_euryale.AAC.7
MSLRAHHCVRVVACARERICVRVRVVRVHVHCCVRASVVVRTSVRALPHDCVRLPVQDSGSLPVWEQQRGGLCICAHEWMAEVALAR